jgi:hypothetical protein
MSGERGHERIRSRLQQRELPIEGPTCVAKELAIKKRKGMSGKEKEMTHIQGTRGK